MSLFSSVSLLANPSNFDLYWFYWCFSSLYLCYQIKVPGFIFVVLGLLLLQLFLSLKFLVYGLGQYFGKLLFYLLRQTLLVNFIQFLQLWVPLLYWLCYLLSFADFALKHILSVIQSLLNLIEYIPQPALSFPTSTGSAHLCQ